MLIAIRTIDEMRNTLPKYTNISTFYVPSYKEISAAQIADTRPQIEMHLLKANSAAIR